MKRNNFSTSLKGYTSYSPINKSPIIKESSYANCNNTHGSNNGSSEDYMNGYPWPPRSYTCSFCRKEFKSAQALGGHMNVHRRDRARLRQSSPTHEGHAPMLNLNLNPTTNPSFSTSSSLSFLPSSSSSCSTTLKPVTCTLPLFVSQTPPPSSSSASVSEYNRWVVVDGILVKKSKIAELPGVREYDQDECKMRKKGEILKMDLEIGLPRDYDLDLELRLGTYS